MTLHPFHGIQPTIASSAYVNESARVVGDVVIGAESSIWFNAVIRGDVNSVRIGTRTNVQDGTVIHVTSRKHPTRVGDDVTIGHNATLHGCTVGNRCLIGIAAIVLDGAEVGDECMVAAGTVITPRTIVPARSLVVGTPGRVKRELTETEIRHLKQSAANYVQYRLEYMSEVAE